MSTLKRAYKIVEGFGVRAKRVTHVQKEVYRVVLKNRKTYSLKRMPVSSQNLRWMDRALQGVRRNGYRKLAWRDVRTKEGRRLSVRAGGAPYVLVPWIEGRWPNVHSKRDMRACGIAIAKFHRAAGKFRYPQRGALNMLGQWPSMFKEQDARIALLVRKAAHSRHKRPMDRFLVRHGKEILSYSAKALKRLRKHRYRKLSRTGGRAVTLCHGDGGPTNFIRNAKGMHLIDFETLRIDLRAYDLFRVIYNSCKDHHWKFSIARNFLDGYQSVTKLRREDFAMLRALLRFPRTVSLLLNRYPRESGRMKERIAREMPHALRAERGMEAFCRKLDRYARS